MPDPTSITLVPACDYIKAYQPDGHNSLAVIETTGEPHLASYELFIVIPGLTSVKGIVFDLNSLEKPDRILAAGGYFGIMFNENIPYLFVGLKSDEIPGDEYIVKKLTARLAPNVPKALEMLETIVREESQ